MECHNTKNILRIMEILGHRSTAKVAHSEQEVCQLIEAGFEFVCDYEHNKVFRKRK